ncbi:MAG: hypothetical protein LC649_10010 [Bacteroidales bacterium]|nr:hypothetical protein [Bacteroidales bacterium]
MAKKKNINLFEIEKTRDFSLSLEAIIGSISLFYASINGIPVIQADGTKKRTSAGKIPDAQVRIKIRVVGIGEATFKLSIDLPGMVDDQSLTLILNNGYFEMDITL